MVTLEFPVRFENPTYSLVGMVLAGAVVALFYFSFTRLRIAQKRLELVQWRRMRSLVRFTNISTKTGVVVALSFLLATPYFPTTIEMPIDKATEEQMAQYSITAMLLLDVSYSMNNSDLTPSRLEFSKNIVKLLLNKMDSNDLVGFISFAGQVYDSVLPTSNRTKVTEKIDNQTIHQSTSMGTALETAIGVLENKAYSASGRAIILFSDGKNNVGTVTSAVDDAIILKIPVFTVSAGTYGLGEADPLALREISDKTGGKFYEARNEDIESLATSVAQISHEVKVGALKGAFDKLVIEARDYQSPSVFFSVLLIAALFLTWFTGV